MQGQTEAGSWEVFSRPPAAGLRGFVARYLGYREHALLPVRRREVPTGRVALILSFGPTIRVVGGPGELGSFVAVVGNRWAETEYVGEQYGVQVDVTPLAAGMVLGTRLGEFTGVAVDLVDVLGATGRRLVEQLADAPGWAERFDLLDAFLLARLSGAHSPSPAAAWAWTRLRETNGQASVASLADQFGCSTRYLSAQVLAHVGVPPKQLARVLRVQHAIQLLGTGAAALATTASVCGYADQPHFGRDFLDITGTTPGAWAAHPASLPLA
ncbi:helix-turn-helix domain-containing protein [Allokutzneria sp. A3M-2-11 16]|uniref:helix-turn-helix domain-containing protein n=1 Tax=Allokutzneria sp. A3M-2-11 16 TaxID=2962043 RepID=UPI0020B7B47A|nr:helix-turn-helix domain-containing protein [Allokutzneria sp. A3M-2-11 16]MCP3805104.1 helix-turn-helix domain-containing protein [Allokutzneria sp. A3M-2-11 16]